MHDILIHELLIGFQPNLVIWNHIQVYGPILLVAIFIRNIITTKKCVKLSYRPSSSRSLVLTQ